MTLSPGCEPDNHPPGELGRQPPSLTLRLLLACESDAFEPPYLVEMFQGFSKHLILTLLLKNIC